MGIFGETAPLIVIGFFVSFVDLILHIVGFATPYWYKYPDLAYYGLWRYCLTFDGNKCFSMADGLKHKVFSQNLKGAQVLERLALAAFFLTTVSATLRVFFLKHNRMLYITTSGFSLMAAIFGIIGAILFTTTKVDGLDSKASHLNYSFALVIISAIGGIFVCILFIVSWRRAVRNGFEPLN